MKKSNYVTKYDYIAYYTKQPAMWFFSNAELEAAYKLQYQMNSHKDDFLDDLDDEDEYGEDSEDSSIDSYDLFKLTKENNELNSQYLGKNEEYKKILEETRNVDDSNPLIVEGRIIDQKSKEFIVSYFTSESLDTNILGVKYDVFDFDVIGKGLKLEQQAIYTKEKLFNYENVIIFQPVFIDENRMIATKCDALVKTGNDIKIIETKATSTAKLHHFLDLLFQFKILNSLYPKQYSFSYYLCLIKYELLPKKEISFVLTDRINLSKSPSASDLSDLDDKQCLKLAQPFTKFSAKTNKESIVQGAVLDELFDNIFDPEVFNSRREKVKDLLEVTNDEFNEVILKLWEHKKSLTYDDMPGQFIPSKEDKSNFKNTDMWLNLRKLYSAKDYRFFNYSGNVLNLNWINLEKMGKNHLVGTNDIEEFLKGREKLSDVYRNNFQRFCLKDAADFQINEEQVNELLKKLKPKKVYFDFESINPSIRAIDNSLPFTQAITQNSVIKDHGNGVLNEKCINMVRDPNCIDVPWFKELIDELYEGEDYSYVVYNKNFETKRLEEMANFINEDEYFKKVKCINENIYDLADFFTITKDKSPICIKELGGFYSIKKVLPLVEKYQPNIFKETGCKDYKTLEVSNGLMCQQKTMARFYDKLSDDEWQELVKNVSIYCENDVRAMVAVEYLVTKYILKEYAPDCLNYLRTN